MPVAVNDSYAEWWRKAVVIGAVMILLCGTTIALCHLSRREICRRQAAESALVDTANRRSVAAATDGLTGLANRHAFDERLSHECQRAKHTNLLVALLMLDAVFLNDGFNDQYGHPEGDQVLRRIAACIAGNIRRIAS